MKLYHVFCDDYEAVVCAENFSAALNFCLPDDILKIEYIGKAEASIPIGLIVLSYKFT